MLGASVMIKQLVSCFCFVLVLTIIAASNTLFAEPEQYSSEQIKAAFKERDSAIDFLAKKIVELDSTCVKKASDETNKTY